MEIGNIIKINIDSDYDEYSEDCSDRITITKLDGTPLSVQDELKLNLLGEAFNKYTLEELESKLK